MASINTHAHSSEHLNTTHMKDLSVHVPVHWQSHAEHGIVYLTFKKKDAKVNTLDQAALEELLTLLNIHRKKDYRGLVIRSGQDSGFIVGADIHAFSNASEKKHQTEEIENFLRLGQKVFDEIETIATHRFPIVAQIHGPCLGGGFELALACTYRIAVNHFEKIDLSSRIFAGCDSHLDILSEKKRLPSGMLGLPEVKLGIHPGWGGCHRLSRLIGPFQALSLIISGRVLTAEQAKKKKIIDFAVPDRVIDEAVRAILLQPRPVSFFKRGMAWLYQKWIAALHWTLVRQLIASYMEHQLKKKIKAKHYPAPFAALQVWKQTGLHAQQSLEHERKSLLTLCMTETAESLTRLFFIQNQIKRCVNQGQPLTPIRRVHIIGAGAMGRGIACACLTAGMRVTMHDTSRQALNSASRDIASWLREKKQSHALNHFILDGDAQDLASADLIIEAVIESLDVKVTVLRDILKFARKDSIIATNTSSITIESIVSHLNAEQHPERILGIHFFNPAQRMKLVEVVRGEQTSESVFQSALHWILSIQKLPLPVKSAPGFLVNRVLMPYLMEAIYLLQDGYSASWIDQIAVDFGMPMGPIRLADHIGLDICMSVLEVFAQQDSIWQIPEFLRQKIARGELGLKSKHGFYMYDEKKKIIHQEKNDFSEKSNVSVIEDRLILPMLNAALICWYDNIVQSADDIDVGMILGCGFPAFRGGPMHMLKKYNYHDRMKSLHHSIGARMMYHEKAWNTWYDA